MLRPRTRLSILKHLNSGIFSQHESSGKSGSKLGEQRQNVTNLKLLQNSSDHNSSVRALGSIQRLLSLSNSLLFNSRNLDLWKHL